MKDHLTVVDHPLVQHKLTLMRQKDTPTSVFRQLLREISQLLAYEVTRELPMVSKTIETPLVEMEAPALDGRKLALVSILRAGNGLLDGMLELIPSARVGFVGLYRDEETLKPVQYYFKVPTEARRVAAPSPKASKLGRRIIPVLLLARTCAICAIVLAPVSGRSSLKKSFASGAPPIPTESITTKKARAINEASRESEVAS